MTQGQRDAIRSLWKYLGENVPYNVHGLSLEIELGDIEELFSTTSATGMMLALICKFSLFCVEKSVFGEMSHK